MYQLHYFPSNANAAPHMVLEEIGAEIRTRARRPRQECAKIQGVPEDQSERPHSGAGRRRLLLFESAAIVLHLVDQHPEAGLAPKVGTPERAKFYQWLTFLTNSLQEELMIWQYPERSAGDDAAATAVVKQGAEKRAQALSRCDRSSISRRTARCFSARSSAPPTSIWSCSPAGRGR